MLLESGSNGGLSRSRETSEPDGSTLLLAKFTALLAAKTFMPCNVAGGGVRSEDEDNRYCTRNASHVAIFTILRRFRRSLIEVW